jgi:hypothetical protein
MGTREREHICALSETPNDTSMKHGLEPSCNQCTKARVKMDMYNNMTQLQIDMALARIDIRYHPASYRGVYTQPLTGGSIYSTSSLQGNLSTVQFNHPPPSLPTILPLLFNHPPPSLRALSLQRW